MEVCLICEFRNDRPIYCACVYAVCICMYACVCVCVCVCVRVCVLCVCVQCALYVKRLLDPEYM